MSIVSINVSSGGGPITVEVVAPSSPNPIAGVVWEWDQNDTGVGTGPAGQFTTKVPDVPLGAPSVIANHLFLVKGSVIAMNDNPPVPYQVVVIVKQGDTPVHNDVPDNGTGQIGNNDQQFSYAFRIVAK